MDIARRVGQRPAPHVVAVHAAMVHIRTHTRHTPLPTPPLGVARAAAVAGEVLVEALNLAGREQVRL